VLQSSRLPKACQKPTEMTKTAPSLRI
jgi:hypothetical protein